MTEVVWEVELQYGALVCIGLPRLLGPGEHVDTSERALTLVGDGERAVVTHTGLVRLQHLLGAQENRQTLE